MNYRDLIAAFHAAIALDDLNLGRTHYLAAKDAAKAEGRSGMPTFLSLLAESVGQPLGGRVLTSSRLDG